MSVLLDSLQSLNGSLCCSHVGKVRNLALYGCLSDIAVIAKSLLIERSVDDNIYRLVCDLVQYVRTSLCRSWPPSLPEGLLPS